MTAVRGNCLNGRGALRLTAPDAILALALPAMPKGTRRDIPPPIFAFSLYGVALATLDDDPDVRPDTHAFIVDKAPWFAVTDDLPQYPARIPGQNAPHTP